MSPDLDIWKINTIDRFAVFLYLKIHSCGSTIDLVRKCPDCDTNTKIKMDLNVLIENIASSIDRKFEFSLNTPICNIICDLPSLEYEYNTYLHNVKNSINETDINYIIDNYVVSHIRKLYIKDSIIDLDKLSSPERREITKNIPAKMILDIKKYFLIPIHESINRIDFLNTQCTNDKCKKPFEAKFDILNINDIIKIIYRDESIESSLRKIFNIASASHLSGDIMKNLSPLEINILESFIPKEENNMPSTLPSPTPEYPYITDTSHMEESPSEFSNWSISK